MTSRRRDEPIPAERRRAALRPIRTYSPAALPDIVAVDGRPNNVRIVGRFISCCIQSFVELYNHTISI